VSQLGSKELVESDIPTICVGIVWMYSPCFMEYRF
jgi:hypothetical protein